MGATLGGGALTMDRVPLRLWLAIVAAGATSTAAMVLIPDPMAARATAIAATCLCLWLSEAVPSFVPTLLLLAAVPLVLAPFGPAHSPGAVLGWLADPVLALFFGGFTLGAAISRHGLDQTIAAFALRTSGSSNGRLLAVTMITTAGMSLWMSNIAATAMALSALKPVLDRADERLRRALLIGVAMAANVGGMGTPIGSGPNAVAIASASGRLSFLGWMSVGLPVAAISVALVWLVIRILLPFPSESERQPTVGVGMSRRGWMVLILLTLAIAAWLSEPLHHVAAPTVALVLATILFATGLLDGEDFRRLDWATLALIGGGIALGRLLEHTGLIAAVGAGLRGGHLSPGVLTAALVIVAASLSAVMSNTGAATLLIPLANAVDPAAPSLAVVVALGCSFGVPFVISTPQNAMAAGAGARSADLLWVGLPLMGIGCTALILGRTLIASVLGAAP